MVDREERLKAIDALAKYMRGEIDNFALDDATFSVGWKDKTIEEISHEIWFSYDDLKRHKVSVSRPGWQLFRRCIAFLQSDLELPVRCQDDSRDATTWPFQHRTDIYRARPNLSALRLPRFDPAVHRRPIRTRVGLVVMYVPITLLVLMVLDRWFHWIF